MSSSIGNKLKVQLFGQSHSRAVGVVIDGLPAGEKIDMGRINEFLRRRAGGRNPWSTQRAESDAPNVVSGLVKAAAGGTAAASDSTASGNATCGAPLCALFENADTRPSDYEEFRAVPRPSHADYTAYIKHSANNDVNGGGHFSARLTLPLCFAGAVCLQLLERRGVAIDAHIHSIGDIADEPFDALCASAAPVDRNFPVLNKAAGEKMISTIEAASADGDSLGGIVEGGVWGLPVGLGEPIFDNLESRLAYALFAIPAVKGVEFGAGFSSAKMRGSTHNDPFCMVNGKIKTRTNNSGGIQGGISNGMPVIFRAAFKPTPSISIEQQSVNLLTGEDVALCIKGRHDPCVVPRAVPCVVAAVAIVMLDIILGG